MKPRLILRSILQLNTGVSGIPYSFGLQQSSVMPIYACHTTSRFAGGLIILALYLPYSFVPKQFHPHSLLQTKRTDMTDQAAYNSSLKLLQNAATPHGFIASTLDRDNYHRIWTRDGILCSIAALVSEEPDLQEAVRNTIHTIFEYQHPTGFMPSNVTPEQRSASYGGPVGRVDNVCWAVIGVAAYTLYTGDTELAEAYSNHVASCFAVMDAWEFNGKGLMYIPQSGDWADEYVHHGYILYDQLLRMLALEMYSYLDAAYKPRARELRALLAINFWKHRENVHHYSPHLARMMKGAPEGYWLMGFNPANLYRQYDLAANALALLAKLGDEGQQAEAADYMAGIVTDTSRMLPAYAPVIFPEDREMRALKMNYAYEFRNVPYEFQNGGLWPVWNGLAAAGLARNGKYEAANLLTSYIHESNSKSKQKNDGGFYENLNGLSGTPSGVPRCTWSAAGAIIAEKALEGNFLINKAQALS